MGGVSTDLTDQAPTLYGRDIDSGAERWRVVLPKPQGTLGGVSVARVGQTLLVVDRNGVLHGLELRTGKQRWATPPAHRTLPQIADAQTVAMLRCDDRDRCTVEARAVADGRVRWSAPASDDGSYLGAPRLTKARPTRRPCGRRRA